MNFFFAIIKHISSSVRIQIDMRFQSYIFSILLIIKGLYRSCAKQNSSDRLWGLVVVLHTPHTPWKYQLIAFQEISDAESQLSRWPNQLFDQFPQTRPGSVLSGREKARRLRSSMNADDHRGALRTPILADDEVRTSNEAKLYSY
jgi:hypothetical protein